MTGSHERRRIALFTSSRADLGPLGPVIAALDAEPAVELVVIATGTHSDAAFGGRVEDIQVSGGNTVEIIDAKIAGTDPSDLSEAFGRIAEGVSEVLAIANTDFLVVLGDRWELLAAASAAILHGVAIAHIHGGETTEGAIDERIRHSITKLADLHLCATVDSARRIRHLGEEPWRIVVTGAPGLDRIATIPPAEADRVAELLGFVPERPLGVVVYHPVTADRTDVGPRARAVLDASARTLGAALVLYPGADPGSDTVVAEIEAAVDRHPNLVAIRNLGDEYLPVLKASDALIGNSSSGIIEATSLELPVVDVGIRQRGRLRAENVIHADHDEDSVRRAIQHALEPALRSSLANVVNPYGDGTSAQQITRALLEVPLHRLHQKPFAHLDQQPPPIESMSIRPAARLRDAAEAIDRGRCQIALVVDADGSLVGTISDGDLRRALITGANLSAPIDAYVTTVPILASEDDSMERVLALMQQAGVTQIPIVDGGGRVVGLHMMRALMSDFTQNVEVQ